MDYEDIQVRVPSGVAQVERNVGTAEISGVELEVKWQPADSWFIEAGFGYTDAGFEDIDIDTTGLPDVTVLDNPFATIQPGNEFDHVPETSFSASVSKEVSMDAGSLVFRLGVNHQSGYFNEPLNLPQIETPSTDIWDAGVLWTAADDRYTVNLGVKNFTDEEFLATGYFNPTIGTIEHLLDRGMTWSLTGKYNF